MHAGLLADLSDSSLPPTNGSLSMSDDTLPVTRRLGDPSSSYRVDTRVTQEAEPESKIPPPPSPPAPAPKKLKPGRRKKRKSFVRRHKILIALGALLAVVAASAGGYYYWLNHQLSSIERVDAGITALAGKEGGGEKSQALNILLLGADNGQDQETVAEDLKDGKWTPGLHRSDTLMIAHIPADRDSVQIVSIPRDTWVPIDGVGDAKINAAFADGGPALAVDTVEQLTGIHIDHLAIIDWSGFKDLTTALGGVRVYIPETFYDDSQNIEWTQGWHDLKGQEALAYVRTRHGLANGDFDRINRQQNFMRATMGKLLSSTKNIITMTKVINTVTKFLTIDDGWDNDEIKNLALSLRNIHASDVQFLQAPFGSYGTSSDGQSYVSLAPRQSQRLFDDIKSDSLDDYLAKYPNALLDGDKQVN
jgi:LCP family protein required for cell wall assembly